MEVECVKVEMKFVSVYVKEDVCVVVKFECSKFGWLMLKCKMFGIGKCKLVFYVDFLCMCG